MNKNNTNNTKLVKRICKKWSLFVKKYIVNKKEKIFFVYKKWKKKKKKNKKSKQKWTKITQIILS